MHNLIPQYTESNLIGKITRDKLTKLAKHQHFNQKIDFINKTGLGSSACLVTLLTLSLCEHYSLIDTSSTIGKTIAHNISQLAHSLAQGKIGSGFDISAAMYGSHIYTRFNEQIIGDLLSELSTLCKVDVPLELPSHLTRRIWDVCSKEWDNSVQPFHLPKGIKLLLADVKVGSSTPKLVSKVLDWKAKHPSEANIMWQDLNKNNSEIEEILSSLIVAENDTDYLESVLKYPSPSRFETLLTRLRQSFVTLRAKMRQLSSLANVPIEPPSQTTLLDACFALPGVVGGGVPGAGGFDAIFLLVIDDKVVVDGVFALWEQLDGVAPLLSSQSDCGFTLE
jgi:phosphomevalonate kinase